jgi:uncharacterized membrane protein YdjX (TVP38/TMEM64 family)
VALIALVVGAAIVLAIWRPAAELRDLREWMEGLGPLGPLAFILLRAGAALALIPGSALSAMAGALFGPVWAVACVSLGKTLGACVAFLVSRYFARDAVARWLEGRDRFRRLDDLVTAQGAVVVALLRLAPVVPFNVQNYGFGLTRISFGTYLLWSWLCMLPGTVLVVSGTGVVAETLATGRVPWVLVGVLAASVLMMLGLAVYALLRLRAGVGTGDRAGT